MTAPAPEPVWIHPSRWMDAVTKKRRQALSLGRIPAEFLYGSHRQAQLWLDVARRHAPKDLDAFYRRAFAALPWKKLPHLVGLGPGGAQKEAWLQDKLQAARFTPVDGSESLALLSARRLKPLLLHPPCPLVADLTACSDLPDWLSTFDQEEPRLYTAFGLTPTLSSMELDSVLRSYLRPQDQLLISANLLPDGDISRILPQYENPETRTWVTELLIQWGLAPHLGDLEIRTENQSGGETCILAISNWKHDAIFDWEGTPFAAAGGAALSVFSSWRYSPEGFVDRLARAGFQIMEVSLSPCGQEGLWLVQA